jgi:hypothetical protein
VRFPLIFLFLTQAALIASGLGQADLIKLSDEKEREAEIRRIHSIEDPSRVSSYLYLKSPQKDGSSLHLVGCLQKRKVIYSIGYEYQIDRPDELFREFGCPQPLRLEPNLQKISDYDLKIFDSTGHPTSSDESPDYLKYQYCYDFDQDGTLDLASAVDCRLAAAPSTRISLFSLKTVETTPKTWLRIIYNWHPIDADLFNAVPVGEDPLNDWTFQCRDEDHDGFPEIIFLPAEPSATSAAQKITFRWNPATHTYTPGDLPAHAHVRLLKPEETLEGIAQQGGLGYPVLESEKDQKETQPQKAPAASVRYVFKSLKGMPDQDVAGFFDGKPSAHSQDEADHKSDNVIPNGLAQMSPVKAALALADANRNEQHRALYAMKVDDRNGIAPPTSGWLIADWSIPGCFHFSSTLHALHLDPQKPILVVIGDDHDFHNQCLPWVSPHVHQVRRIALTTREAIFIAETLFWLDRIRTYRHANTEMDQSGGGSPSDGFATLSLIPENGPSQMIANATSWATNTIANRWREDYTQEVAQNLNHLFLTEFLPSFLKDRWNNDSSPDSALGNQDRKAREKAYQALLTDYPGSHLPLSVLLEIATDARDDCMTELLPLLKQRLSDLPPPTEQEIERNQLEKKLYGKEAASHGEGLDAPDPAYERYQKLEEELRDQPAATLRKPLTEAITLLEIAGNPDDLLKLAKADESTSPGAMLQLKRSHPDAWAELLSHEFPQADLPSQRLILENLIVAHLSTAGKIISLFTEPQKKEFILQIARFHRAQQGAITPDDAAALMDSLQTRNTELDQRIGILLLLAESKLSDGLLKKFESLLVQEIKTPQKDDLGWKSTRSTAIQILSRFKNSIPSSDLMLDQLPSLTADEFPLATQIINTWEADPSKRDEKITRLVRSRLDHSDGMMDRVFITALAYGLKDLGNDITALASADPMIADGDDADFAKGYFQGLAGQHYHTAREISALWTETDPATLARMWVSFALRHEADFSADDDIGQKLRAQASAKIRQLPKDQRSATISYALSTIPNRTATPATREWLKSLNDG